jgi:hypothetical protein
MAPITHIVDKMHVNFPCATLPSSNIPTESALSTKSCMIGLNIIIQKDFNYNLPNSNPSHLKNKKKLTLSRSLTENVTEESLLHSIKTYYAYLLTPAPDGDGYIIDTRELNSIKLRKRYRPLGCVIKVDKNFTDVSITDVVQSDKSITPSEFLAIAQLGVTIYSIIYNLVVSIYSAITSIITLSSRVSPATSITNDATTAVGELTTTQKSLYPFQFGTPQFLDKVDKLLLANRGLVYHLGGFDQSSLKDFIITKSSSLKIKSINSINNDTTLALLPVVKLGQEFLNHITVFIKDMFDKGCLNDAEVSQFLSNFKFDTTEKLTDPQKLSILLWYQLFNHTLLVKSAGIIWKKFGVYMTTEGDVIHDGIIGVVEAFIKFFSLGSTKLTGCSDLLGSPVLARKFISLSMAMKKSDIYKDLEFMNPQLISITLV